MEDPHSHTRNHHSPLISEDPQIPEYHSILDTILNWSTEILASHHNRHSNGPLESINNLIQTLRRTAHGFTNPYNYAARASY